jgi:chaperonin GroES
VAKDSLARGARTAMFAAGDNKGKIELKNLSTEPRNSVKEIKIDRKRTYKRITPIGEMLLVQRRDPESVSAGGILIPEDGKDRPAEGTILAMGSDVEGLDIGDHLIFGKYSGTEYPWGGEVLLFMRSDEVIAVVEE